MPPAPSTAPETFPTPPGDPLAVAAVLTTMEPGSEEEAAYVRRLTGEGWSRRELVELLNRDTERRQRRADPTAPATPTETPASDGPAALPDDPKRWPAAPRYLLEAVYRRGWPRGAAERLARRCWLGDVRAELIRAGVKDVDALLRHIGGWTDPSPEARAAAGDGPDGGRDGGDGPGDAGDGDGDDLPEPSCRCPECGRTLAAVAVTCKVCCPSCGEWVTVRPGRPSAAV